MQTPSESSGAVDRSVGRLYAVAGIAAALLGPIFYVIQILAKALTVPWYLLLFGMASVGLSVYAWVCVRTLWRVIGIGICCLLAGLEAYFLVSLSKLSAYAGPVAVGRSFPDFTTIMSDGSTFNQDSLKGEQNTVMVFFRGRW